MFTTCVFHKETQFFNYHIGDGIEAVISGSYAHIFVTGTGGGAVAATGTTTYLLVGQPEPLETITGAYWRTPGGMAYATGSLNAFINGLSQVKDIKKRCPLLPPPLASKSAAVL